MKQFFTCFLYCKGIRFAAIALLLVVGVGNVWGATIPFLETFKNCSATGGNDGTWSNISGTTYDISADQTGWSFTRGYAASQCARFGASRNDGSATTPSITVSNGSNYTLSFKAAPWGSESSTMTITVTGGKINNSTSVTTSTMSISQWNSYEYTIVANATSLTVNFNASQNRFFLDDVQITSAASCSADPSIGTASLNGTF